MAKVTKDTVVMKTNYTTKQFALFLRKLCEKYDEDWRMIPRTGVEPVEDKYRLEELQMVAEGAWYFFQVKDGRKGCGVYVGPKRSIITACDPYNDDSIFECRVLDCLHGK